MTEPSRPPPPKAYVPSRKPGVPPSRPSTGPAGGQTELPIPPRPAPEDIPPVSPTELTKSKGGRGPPPPPAPYSKRPSTTKLSDGAEDEADKGQAPPKSRPPAPRPAKAPASRPSKPPASSSKKMDITIVSAQPMTSDVIPPPAKGATPTTDPPMPTEPPPEPPTETKIPPPKPNRSPPVSKAVLDKESEPLPKRGPAPPKPVRGSPPLPLRGGQDEQQSSSPKEITDRRPSRGSPHVRKAPPPPAGRTRPPPPQSKAPPIPSTEPPSEYTALIPTPANNTTPDVEYMVPQAPTPASEYTEPVSSKTLSKSSADYIEPVSGKSDKPKAPVHKAPPPPVSRPSAPPTSRPRPPSTSHPPPPPAQEKEEPREIESPTHLYAEVSPSTSQTNLEEATPSSKDTPPPVPNSPRPSGQPRLSDSKTSPSPPKKSPPTKPPSSRPRPPPPQFKKEEVTEDKATPTAVPTARPRPPLPRTTSKDEGIKATPTPRSKPPLPVATPPQETNETPPTSRPRPPPPKAVPPIPEKSKEENKTPPTSRPRPLPPKTKTDDQDQDMEKTPPPSKPHPPKPVPRQDSSGEVKAQPPMKPKPRPKKTPSVTSVEETETTPTNVETATPTEPIQDEVKKEATPPAVVTRPPPKKPPVAPKRSISKTDSGSDEPLPPDTPTIKETSPPPAKPRPPPQAKPRPPPPKSKEEDKTEEPPPLRSLPSATPSSAPPTRPTSGPTKAPPPSRPGQGPKPKPARPPGTAPPKPTPPVPSTRSKPPNKDGPPVPTARRGTASKEDSDAPPPLPPRPEPGHPLYRYVCSNPHGIAKTNKEAPEADELSYYEGDVIELIEKIDDHWYYACNADNDMQEGLILAKEMKIIKRLPGQDKVMEDGPCAVAMTAFEGRSSDELSFKEGTLIMLISRVGGDEWLRGMTLKGEEGIFPKSFVEVVEDLPPDAIEELKPASPEYDIPDGPYCIAIETFVGESPDDLSFDVGDLIEITERIDDSWLRGTTQGRSGMFPQVFVDVKVDAPVGIVGGGGGETENENKNENVVKALFDYEGEEGDLSFKEGDMITLLSKVSDEWIFGQLDGREGMFPSSFISHVPESLPMKTTEEETKVDEATPTPEPPKTPTGECEALFDYESDNLGDLSFTAGEKITLTEWINDEWCAGAIGDRAGMFPLSFVKIIKDLPKDSGSVSKAAAPKSQKKVQSEELSDLMPKAKAIRNFEPASSLEMRVQTGDMIILLSHEPKNMYMGENVTTGEFGNFPANCVEVIVPLP